MPTRPEVLILLKTLEAAYPERRMEADTADLYVRHLAEIPFEVLQKAVHAHIAASVWFPKIAELRQAAARLANTSHFATLAPAVDALAEQAQALEDAFYYEGRLDVDEWETLAVQFDSRSRPHRAARVRSRLRATVEASETMEAG